MPAIPPPMTKTLFSIISVWLWELGGSMIRLIRTGANAYPPFIFDVLSGVPTRQQSYRNSQFLQYFIRLNLVPM
jgi:hypothetical protein